MATVAALLVFSMVMSAIAAFGYVRYVQPSRLIDQLKSREIVDTPFGLDAEPAPRSKLIDLLCRLSNLVPLAPPDIRLARRELEAAGFRAESAVAVYSGMRVVGAVLLAGAGFFLQELITATFVLRTVLVIGGAVAGYFAPGFVLDRLLSRRQEGIRAGLPDALDLLVICTEAGSALDQALVTVSRELAIAHPGLCDELNILTLEVLAGKTRQDAMRNFAERTGEEEVRRLVALLVQTDRFGTSISDALRTQSDSMRIRRHQQAEERAGKIGVKLVFPIFFFCLPSLFIIAAGPGMLQLFRTLPTLGH
jgi:tight adherence protein C